MRKFFTYLVALAACLVCSLSAHAQFSATIEMYPSTDYSYKAHDFSLQEVATALGMDAATLASTLDTWMNTEEPTEFMFQLSDFVPTSVADYTADNRGFWMTLDGARVTYGQKETEEGPELQDMYNVFYWDTEAGTFSVGMGQMPNKLAAGTQGHVVLVVAIGEKKATFDMTLSIIEKPQADIPDPVTDLTQLTIVGEKTITWDQYPNMPMNQVVDLSGVAEALGTTDEIIAENLASFLFVPTLELKGEEGSQKPYKTNTLSNESSAGGTGWWLAAVWSDEIEAFSEEVVRCIWGDHSAYRSMYDEQYSYDAATHELTSVTGWENYSQEMGTKYNFDVYVIYGGKAYVLHHTITLTQKPEEDPSKWTSIGEEEQNVSMFQGDNLTVLTLDVDAIATALGCEVSALKAYARSDANGNIDDRTTANNGGFWFSGNGFVCSWGGSDAEGSPFTFYIEPVANLDYSSWNCGQNSAQTQAGTTYTTKIFFFNGAKSETNNQYYGVTVNIAIEKKPDVEVEFTSVATKTLAYRVEPVTEGWGGDIVPGVDLTEMQELIGTQSPVFYGEAKTESGTEYSDAYSCDPKPGFWMDPDGYVSTWQNKTDSPFGVCYLADGTFQLFQFPGGNEAGTVRKATYYLVNTTTGDMITCNISIAFGDVINFEEVGSKEVTLVANPDAEHEVIAVDMADALKALGADDVSSLLNGQCVAALTADGTWSDPQIPSNGVAIDAQGFFNTESRQFDIYITPGDQTFAEFSIDNITGTEIPDDFSMSVKMAIQRDVEGELKQYTLNVTIVSLAKFTAINDVRKANEKAVIYDLSGRRTDAARKGVYIINGQKVVK